MIEYVAGISGLVFYLFAYLNFFIRLSNNEEYISFIGCGYATFVAQRIINLSFDFSGETRLNDELSGTGETFLGVWGFIIGLFSACNLLMMMSRGIITLRQDEKYYGGAYWNLRENCLFGHHLFFALFVMSVVIFSGGFFCSNDGLGPILVSFEDGWKNPQSCVGKNYYEAKGCALLTNFFMEKWYNSSFECPLDNNLEIKEQKYVDNFIERYHEFEKTTFEKSSFLATKNAFFICFFTFGLIYVISYFYIYIYGLYLYSRKNERRVHAESEHEQPTEVNIEIN